MIVARSSGTSRVRPLLEGRGRRLVRRPALLEEPGERLTSAAGVVEDEDALELRALRLDRQELGGLLGRRREGDGGAAVADDVLDLVGDHRREDRDEDGAVALAGEVDRRPLGTVLREEDDGSAVRDADGAERRRRRPSPRPRTWC